MEAICQHDRAQFIRFHLFLLALLSAVGFVAQPIGAISIAFPFVIAILPLPFYCVPKLSERTAKTCVYSTGAALLLALAIDVVYIGGWVWLLSGMKFTW